MKLRSSSPWFVTGAALAMVAPGCALDDRTLTQKTEGIGQSIPPENDGGLGDASAESDRHVPAEGGRSTDAHVETLDASDAEGSTGLAFDGGAGDGGGCPECDESLVANVTFDRDTSSWNADPNITLQWRPDDAEGASASGSMATRNGTEQAPADWSFAAATQCIAAVGGASYEFDVATFVPPSQVAGGAGVGAWFFSSTGCAGTPEQTYSGPPTDKTNVWVDVHGYVTAPKTAQSMLVRLVALKPGDPPFDVLFDSVRVLRR